MSILTAIAAVLVLFFNTTAQPLRADMLEKTFPEARAMELSVEGGSIELIGEQTGRIEMDIECRKEFDEYYDLTSNQQDGVLKIEIKLKKKDSGLRGLFKSFNNKPKLKVSLQVPFDTECTLNTSGGSIDICSLNAPLDARTSGGRIICYNVRGDVALKTSGGRIECGQIAGSLEAKTSGGRITLSRCASKTVAKTSGGGISVDSHTGCLDAKTSGGSISATFIEQPCNDCVLSTSGGGITLTLPEGSNADIYAKTSGGSVSTELPVTSTVTGKHKRNKLEGTIGNGGPSITLKTSGGGIRIKQS